MAVSTCTVSGTCVTPSNSALTNVTVKAVLTNPFFYSDGTWIAPYEVTTTTDANGAWSLVLVETTTAGVSMVISFDYPSGGQDRRRQDYTVIIPNQASATFSSLSPA